MRKQTAAREVKLAHTIFYSQCFLPKYVANFSLKKTKLGSAFHSQKGGREYLTINGAIFDNMHANEHHSFPRNFVLKSNNIVISYAV